MSALVNKRRTQEERSAGMQSALVEAAAALLCEVGYAGTTTAEVARRAGATTGAMQHHYGSMNQLMLAVMRRLTEEFEQAYAGFPAFAALPLAERCSKVVDALAAYYCAPRYVAIWELYVGSRCERELNVICVDNRARAVAGLEKVWLQAFAGVKASRQDLLALMEFTLTFLRSHGLNRSLGTAARSSAKQLALMKETLLEQLER
jgi:AcrR family transcriptional regulator